MRIVCFTDSLVSGGAQRQLVNLAILFKQENYDVHFLVYRNIPFFQDNLEHNDIPIHLIEAKNYIDRVLKVYSAFHRLNPDLIISFLETPNFISCISSIGPHHWKLITNELSAKESSFQGWKNKIFKWFERFSDWTVCNSNNAKNMWISHYPQYSDKISTIYNPIILPETLQTIRSESDKVTIVIPASYQFLKNPIRLIEAINRLTDKDKSLLRVSWYGRKEPSKGEIHAYQEAKHLVNKYGLQEVISLNDETKDIYTYLASCDGVGLFSTVEGLPNAICEGMMMGKPIIMSRVSDYEVLVTPKNGILCDPCDIDSISNALSRFINLSDEEKSNMGKESKRLAYRLFKPSVIIDQWIQLIDQLRC